jgi:methylmalonyl-CoA mutase
MLAPEFRVRDDFPPVSYEEWRALAEADLEGASFEQKLVSKTYEGIAVQPIYTRRDHPGEDDPAGFPGLPPFVRGARALGATQTGWDLRQEHSHPDLTACNQAILEDIQGGVGTHSQTSGWSLTAQDVYNNVVRTCLEAMAATHGHTQSLHTNALDEALALPSDFSARIARNTQLFLQQETDTCNVVDPWGGSYYVERLTHDLAVRAWEHLREVEVLGGMTRAIQAGMPKLRIEEASARTQARIDSGQQVVVGLNKYQPSTPEQIEVLKVDNTAVREAQIAGLQQLRAERDQARVTSTLNALTEAARTGTGNLLEIAVDAARAQATVGEISAALEKVYGRYEAPVRVVRGVYAAEVGGGQAVTEEVRHLVERFEQVEGRKPRILLAKMGQDGHDRGQKVVATALADLGFDVDIGPLFQSAAETARQAVENNVHIVGVSSLAAGHLTLVPQLRKELAQLGREDMLIVVGGVIPPQDYPALYQAGAAEVFGPGTVIGQAASKLIRLLADQVGVTL